MGLKKCDVAHRAWKLLRKGGGFRCWVVMDQLRMVPKYLKRLGHTAPSTHIHYFERQLSFDKTPIFHVKMHRSSSMRFHLPHIPCLNPHVGDFDDDDNGRKSSALIIHDEDQYYHGYEGTCQEIGYDEEGIDERAEEFIAKFYKQMKLQRQISYLQYTETPRS